MTELPRYYVYEWREPIEKPDGPWMKAADVSSRLQQLEQEKATLDRAVEQLCGDVKAIQHDYSDASAALAETREALHQLRTLLKRLHGWDVMDATADGNYWRREIRNAIGEASRVDTL